jgi:hypothetical protein
MIISIGRQTGSGGREIAQKLADETGFKYLDKDALLRRANEIGCFEKMYNFYNEKPVNILVQAIAQNEVARKKTEEISAIYEQILRGGNFIILGRCANYFFRDRDDFVSIFLHAPQEFKVARLMHERNKNRAFVIEYMQNLDSERASFHKYYTGEIWGETNGYDFLINTAKFGIDGVLKLIKTIVK